MFRESTNGRIREADHYVLVDCSTEDAAAVSEIFRDLAVLCIQKQLKRVLVRAGSDPSDERALRDALTTMILVGLPPKFRIAVFAATTRIQARYGTTERDLRVAGVDAKLFDSEEAATHWLNGGA